MPLKIVQADHDGRPVLAYSFSNSGDNRFSTLSHISRIGRSG